MLGFQTTPKETSLSGGPFPILETPPISMVYGFKLNALTQTIHIETALMHNLLPRFMDSLSIVCGSWKAELARVPLAVPSI